MFSNYAPTPLEDWVTDFYKHLNIATPDELQPDTIAERAGIILLQEDMDSHCITNSYIQIIALDSRLPDLQRRQAFFHELCHILRHEGLQGAMPPLFREWQEWDAVNFARCAAIPRHMLHYIRLDGDAVAHASEVFQVPPRLCEERLQQILNRKREASAL